MNVEYSIDNQANAGLEGNTTIIGLPEGNHNLKVYASDGGGNVETAHVDFSVGEPFPTVLVVEIVLLVIIVAIASFVLGASYRRKRRTRDYHLLPLATLPVFLRNFLSALEQKMETITICLKSSIRYRYCIKSRLTLQVF